MSPSEHSVLDVAGIQNGHIHTMWNILMYVCGSMYLLVIIFLVWALLRTRHAQPARGTADSPGIVLALRSWIGIVSVALLGLTIASYAADRGLYMAAQPRGLTLKVTSQQWWWAIEYVSDRPSERFRTANEIHLPVNVPVQIQLSSPDVIHSFWVPNLHGKKDMLPGIKTSIVFRADKPGVYRGQCAEFCGAQHALMAMRVIAESPERYDAWLRHQALPATTSLDTTAQHGRDVFEKSACAGCHTVRGTSANGTLAPDLTHLMSRETIAAGVLANTPDNLAAWIRDPHVWKPGVAMPAVPLSDSDLHAVVAWLTTLQ